MAIKKAKMIAVTSVKGGVGKTTISINLAATFAQTQKTLLVDLDLFNNAVNTSLNVESKSDIFIMSEDIENNRFTQVEDYITKYSDNLDLLASPKDPRTANMVSGKVIMQIINKLKTKYDVIVFDTNNFIGEVNLVTFDIVDEILYVVSNDPIDLKNMRTMSSIYQDMERDNFKILLYEAKDNQKDYFNKYDIKNIIKKEIDYTIPRTFYIKDIDRYIIDGKILVLDNKIRKNHADTLKVFDKIAKDIME